MFEVVSLRCRECGATTEPFKIMMSKVRISHINIRKKRQQPYLTCVEVVYR